MNINPSLSEIINDWVVNDEFLNKFYIVNVSNGWIGHKLVFSPDAIIRECDVFMCGPHKNSTYLTTILNAYDPDFFNKLKKLLINRHQRYYDNK